MAKYKAKESFKTAKNKYFGIHKINILEQGGSIEITEFKTLPGSLQEHLELVELEKAEPVKAKKKNKNKDKGDK